MNHSELAIDVVATLISEKTTIEQKIAASILMKILFTDKERKMILEDPDLYPFSRNDSRVREWTRQIISKGKCEKCCATENLEAHHIIKWADYPKGRIDLINGMCLCHKCHTEEHKDDQSYYMMKAKESRCLL
jgi:hypothetical protein